MEDGRFAVGGARSQALRGVCGPCRVQAAHVRLWRARAGSGERLDGGEQRGGASRTGTVEVSIRRAAPPAPLDRRPPARSSALRFAGDGAPRDPRYADSSAGGGANGGASRFTVDGRRWPTAQAPAAARRRLSAGDVTG